MKLTFNKIFFAIFAFIWSGLIISNFLNPHKTFSESENRLLASFPEYSTETLLNGKYMLSIEQYINDQFVMRDKWITAKNLSERLLLKKDSNGVYFAKDNYLIQKHDNINTLLANKNKEALVCFIQELSQKLGKDKVNAILVPTAFEILKDKLPAFATGFNQQEFNNIVKDALPEGTFTDVSKTLKEHKDEYIFYRTDHHWTTLGAYYAYCEWASKAGFTPLSQSEFEIKEATKEFYGTLYSKVNIPTKPDTMYVYEKKGNPKYTLTYNMAQTKDSLYQWDALESKDKYTLYLGGNNALVKIETQNDTDRKLLILKDSFAHSFVPFALEHYSETHMVDLRYFNMDLYEYIEQNGITDVVVLYNTINFAEDLNIARLNKNQ